MFTGIIEAVGNICSVTEASGGVRVSVEIRDLDVSDVNLGASVAVDGVCLTVVEAAKKLLTFDVSAETLACTRGYVSGARVNLERSLRLADRLDGHLVSGHVDGIGRVVERVEAGANRLLAIAAPAELAKFIARKGAITINGVSLTVNAVTDNTFDVNVIPHTLQVTNLEQLACEDLVNLEVDMFARYVDRLLSSSR